VKDSFHHPDSSVCQGRQKGVFMNILIKEDLPVRNFKKAWQFCVGSGHAALALRTDYCRQLKKVHDQLGIKYVRFHGIFNDDMSILSTFDNVLGIPGRSKFKECTFHRCGLVYDDVLECGMKPFVELSFMPELLAEDPSHGKGFYGSIMSMPKDLALWEEFIKEFISFLLHRYGEEEVSAWYFEVWNEPDLQGMFFKATQADYFKLYEVTVKAIKEVCPKGLSSNNLRDLAVRLPAEANGSLHSWNIAIKIICRWILFLRISMQENHLLELMIKGDRMDWKK